MELSQVKIWIILMPKNINFMEKTSSKVDLIGSPDVHRQTTTKMTFMLPQNSLIPKTLVTITV